VPLANFRLIAEQAATVANAKKREARHQRTVASRALRANADQDASCRLHALTDADDLPMSRHSLP